MRHARRVEFVYLAIACILILPSLIQLSYNVTMVVPSTKKRTRHAAPQYKDHDSSDFSDYDEIEESGSESEEEQPKKKPATSQGVRAQRPQQTSEVSENDLFKALSSPVVAVSELALEWVEAYMNDEENNSVEAFKNLFNLVLKAVGCKVSVQDHDLMSSDSALATVNELNIHFEKQKYHENPFASNNKDVKHFHKNMLEFFGEIIFYAHEKGCLYRDQVQEDQSVLASEFMNSIILWLTALTSSTLRPFRHVATVLILTIATQLCHQVSSLEVSLERQQRQLNNAKNNNKTKRKSANQQQKIRVITNNLEATQFRKDTIDEYLDEITRSVFAHRYRDIDSVIRVECLHALGDWMIANPSYFLLSSYLRYFGWLLSDPTDAVREEVVRVLSKLYKSLKGSIENMAFSFRKFTKRFQQQLINMIWKENLAIIKINLFAIYTELLKIGFLQDSDKIQICSYILYLVESEKRQTSSGNKLKIETSRFISTVAEQGAEAQIDKTAEVLAASSSVLTGANQMLFFKLKVLSAVLGEALDIYESKRSRLMISETPLSSWKLLETIFCDMQLLQEWTGYWEVIVQYLFLDVSALHLEENVGSEEQDVRKSIELSAKDQFHFIAFLAGCVHSSLNNKARKGLEASKDAPTTLIPKLTCHLKSLEDILSKSNSAYPIFLRIWTELLGFKAEPIHAVFEQSNNVAEYNLLHGKVLQFYLECQDMSDDLVELFKTYFSQLLSSNGNGHSNNDENNNVLINPNIYLKVEDAILALLSEITDALNAKGSTLDVFEIDSEQDDPFLCDQKDLCNTLIEISNPLLKLSIIGDVISIIRFVGEPNLDYKGSLLEQISVKLLSKFNLQMLVKLWPRNLYKVMKDVENAWSYLLDFSLISLCWKLEDLMYAFNDGTAETINVDIYLDDVCNISVNLVDSFCSLNEVIFTEDDLPGSETRRSLKIELAEFYFKFGTSVIDFLTSIKAFYDKTQASNRFRDYDAMFRDTQKLREYVSGVLPNSAENAFMNVFLLKEAQLASLLDQTLERTKDENVNLEDFAVQNEEDDADITSQEIVTRFDSSDEEDDEDDLRMAREAAEREAKLNTKAAMRKFKLENEIWRQEKDLSVFSMKLLCLIKAGSFSPSFSQRFVLNGHLLGQTFGTIVSLIKNASESTETAGEGNMSQVIATQTSGEVTKVVS